jgi:Glycosyltransferase
MTRIAYVSTYLPKKCGLATYTFHLRKAVHQAKGWQGTDPVVVMSDSREQPNGNPPGLWPLVRGDREQYVKMAEKLNRSDVDVVSLQHEFGIFGGEAGAHILPFVRHLQKPLVTTFHTVFEHPEEPYRSVQREIAENSDKIIVMNRKAIQYLHDAFGVPTSKIAFIPHGTPEPQAERRLQYRQQLGWSGRKVMMTFGLLSRGKGIELILRILPAVARRVPDVLYAIVGQTHPEVKKFEGESYREELLRHIREYRLEDHVVMVDRFMEEDELIKYLMACDIYVTPYPGMEQITSGTLAYAVGLGRPVLSTPYRYAQDLLSGCSDLLIPYGDAEAWTERIISLLTNEELLGSWRTRIENIGKTMYWPEIGRRHLQVFSEVVQREPTSCQF